MALEGLHPGVDEIGIALETHDPTKDTSSDIKNRWSEKPNQNRVIKPALFEEDDNDHTTYLELAKYSELLGVTDQEGDIIIYNYQSSDYDNSDNMYIEKYFDDQQQGKNDSNFLYKDAEEISLYDLNSKYPEYSQKTIFNKARELEGRYMDISRNSSIKTLLYSDASNLGKYIRNEQMDEIESLMDELSSISEELGYLPDYVKSHVPEDWLSYYDTTFSYINSVKNRIDDYLFDISDKYTAVIDYRSNNAKDVSEAKIDSESILKDADESSTSKVVNNVTPPVVNSVSENVTPSVTNDSGEGKKLYQTKPSGGKLYKSENMETCISIQSLDGSTTYHNSSNDFIIHKVSDTFGDGVRRDELPESELKKFRTNDVIEEDLEEKEELRQKAKNTNKVITHVPKNLNYSYIEDNLAGGDVFYSDLSLPQMADISDI